jgi:hypothetical protein
MPNELHEFLTALDTFIGEWRRRLPYATPPPRKETAAWEDAWLASPPDEKPPPHPDRRPERDKTIEAALNELDRARYDVARLLAS